MPDLARASWQLPTNEVVMDVLVERIDRRRDGVGIAVGIIDQAGRRVVAHGRFKRGGRRLVGHDTVFEIGSITKVFTALLLSDMALRGEVALNDPVARHLPEDVAVPQWGGRAITLADLATHTSGLPRMPTNFAPKDRENPYAEYTVEQLYSFLNSYVLPRDIGAQYEYSNVGGGLLGHVLARRLATDYESLFKERIAGPLGLSDTSVQLSRDQRKRLAHGHDADRRPVPNWDHSEAVAGAGALRSTTDDLLAFLAVALGYEDSPLKDAIDAQLAYPMRKTEQEGFSAGLGWHATESERGRLVWHNGGTAGYRTFIGLNLARGWGAVVLTNAFTTRGRDDIGHYILAGAPLDPAPKRRRIVRVEPSVLEGYVGRYRYPSGAWIEIKRSGSGLAASVNGQGDAPLFATGPTKFFWRSVDAELTFETDANRRAVALVTRSQARGANRAVRE